MQKILAILEKYVQWGVLALGLAFLVYMAWTYLYNNPAAKPMPPYANVTPATVDKTISDDIASQLEQRIKQRHDDFHIDVHLNARVDLSTPATRPSEAADSAPWMDSWAFDVVKEIGPGGQNRMPQVAKLPELPPLAYVDSEPLRTVLAVGAPPGSPPAATGPRQDQDSVTTFWSLPAADLAKAYKAAFGAKLRSGQQNAIFVRASVTRQERLSNGDWANDKTIPVPPAYAPPPPTYPEPAQPQFQANAQAYKTWAQAPGNQAWLVAPTYPAVALPNPELQWMPLETWIPYRAKLQADAAQPIADVPVAAPTPTPPPTPVYQPGPAGLGGPGGGGRFRGGPGGGEAAPPPRPIPQPEQPAPAPVVQTGEPNVVVPPIPRLQPVPDGGFFPAAVAAQGADLELYFNDLGVEAGKTYRYKVRYSLFNPVFGLTNQVASPQLANQFEIDSASSPWSDAITVPGRTRFWCDAKETSNLPRSSGQVAFDVFSWHDGLWQQSVFDAQPGDEIGAAGPQGDFLTHWTVLDLRNKSGEAGQSVLIVPDYGGEPQERSILTDTQSQDYKHFMAIFRAQPAPAAATPGPAPSAAPANGAAPPTSGPVLQ